MAKTNRVHPADLVGYSRLAVSATVGMTSLVEAMHANIVGQPTRDGDARSAHTTGITGAVYGSVRGLTTMVGRSLDAVLTRAVPTPGQGSSSPEREALLAGLNGLIGDYLAETHNPLAIPMSLRRNGSSLILERKALTSAIPGASRKLVVLVHGLSLSDVQWKRDGHDHGEALACDLGYTPVYLHYNSGLHISTNGSALAELLELLVKQWPVPLEEFVIIGHSMGGLVARAACHKGTLAKHRWTRKLRKLIFLGTPHHGSPVERSGNLLETFLQLSQYSSPLAGLGKIRSAGITDLRYGNLLDEDWHPHDRFASARDQRQPVPLPRNVQCYAMAASTSKRPGSISSVLLGDGLVPVGSALGLHSEPKRKLPFPKSHMWVGYGMRHFELLSHPAAYGVIKDWVASPSRNRSKPS